jgi:hypothetical protein
MASTSPALPTLTNVVLNLSFFLLANVELDILKR